MGQKIPFYVEYLCNELQDRVARNPQYSLRAFAKFLDIDASFLSKVMSRKKVLSLKKVDEIVEKLRLTEEERKKFILSIANEQKCASLTKVDNDLTSCD
ncbi:hypothetical protein [Candidatus Uabimicrobium amorphum]|uniref:HTH cro/C1-type domain-containing protein n=1 Tax=Uabimicrobium amorphum TaxID=2596890 RepID=A0A5S9ILQ4_UABAM|nr:hypothetical protein [Candidatus Uabimicrobium amorphum]BBM83651.1 hypothetical protein UABAM_02004 [Candidatus Uabimicrobium amorphum]